MSIMKLEKVVDKLQKECKKQNLNYLIIIEDKDGIICDGYGVRKDAKTKVIREFVEKLKSIRKDK